MIQLRIQNVHSQQHAIKLVHKWNAKARWTCEIKTFIAWPVCIHDTTYNKISVYRIVSNKIKYI